MRTVWVAAVLAIALPLALWSIVPVGSSAAQSPEQLQRKIDRNQSLIGGHKAKERVLTSDISSATQRITQSIMAFEGIIRT